MQKNSLIDFDLSQKHNYSSSLQNKHKIRINELKFLK